jgi:hypothetical protein
VEAEEDGCRRYGKNRDRRESEMKLREGKEYYMVRCGIGNRWEENFETEKTLRGKWRYRLDDWKVRGKTDRGKRDKR